MSRGTQIAVSVRGNDPAMIFAAFGMAIVAVTVWRGVETTLSTGGAEPNHSDVTASQPREKSVENSGCIQCRSATEHHRSDAKTAPRSASACSQAATPATATRRVERSQAPVDAEWVNKNPPRSCQPAPATQVDDKIGSANAGMPSPTADHPAPLTLKITGDDYFLLRMVPPFVKSPSLDDRPRN